MPQRAVEQHHAAGRHGRGDGVIFLAVFRRGIVFVAARQNPRRAIVVPEIRQRPDRIDGDRDVRTRQRDQLRVLMDRLRLLAGAKHQRAERRQQAFLVQHALDDRQHILVQRHFPEQIVIGEKIVDADGLEAFERGLGGAEIVLALDAQQRLLQSLDQFGRGRALDHGVSVVADPLGMGLNLARPSSIVDSPLPMPRLRLRVSMCREA